MNKFKRALAAIAASAVMLTMTGCSDTRYAMTYNNTEKVNAGIYIYNLYSELSYQMTMAYYMSGAAELDFDQEIEGKKMSEYLADKARTATKECMAVTAKFNELGLELTDEDTTQINDNVKNIWSSSSGLLEAEGISKESVRQVVTADTMRTKLFDYFYGTEGVEAVTDDDMKKYVEDNFIRYKAIRITKSDAEDDATKESENKENEQIRDEYLAKAEGYDYDSFDEIIAEYDEYAKAKLEAETSAEEDSTDDGSVDVVGDAGPVAPSAEMEEVEDLDDMVLDESELVNDDGTVVDINDLLSSDEDGTEDDTNPNETMFNFGELDEEGKASITGKLADFVKGIDINKAAAYEDDSFYYVIMKGDVSENSADYASKNRDNLLQTMKGDDFQSKIDSWVEDMKFSENSDAIKKFTAKVVYDKQAEYYESLQ